MCIHKCIYIDIHTYIYIYIERERDREDDPHSSGAPYFPLEKAVNY